MNQHVKPPRQNMSMAHRLKVAELLVLAIIKHEDGTVSWREGWTAMRVAAEAGCPNSTGPVIYMVKEGIGPFRRLPEHPEYVTRAEFDALAARVEKLYALLGEV